MGYTAHEMSISRAVIKHLDALKIRLTATPAVHTPAIFGRKYSVAVLMGIRVV